MTPFRLPAVVSFELVGQHVAVRVETLERGDLAWRPQLHTTLNNVTGWRIAPLENGVQAISFSPKDERIRRAEFIYRISFHGPSGHTDENA